MSADGREPAVRVELLGRFRVVIGGQELPAAPWPSRRACELVQLLALAPDRTLLRDQVITALWPHLDPVSGGANLRKAAHHARQALAAPDAVVLSQGRVALFPSRQVETDVARFESLALGARHSDTATAAVGAYSGDLLPQALYEEWTQTARQRLRRRYLDVLRQAGQWERLVELDPTDEPAYRELMRSALARGDRPGALRWYGRLRTVLGRELGVSPSRETVASYDECIAALSTADSSFVGRDLELARLYAALRSPSTQLPSAVIVRGPAGIGKSALCRQIVDGARAGGWAVVTLPVSEGSRPWSPLVDAIEHLVLDKRSLLDALGDHSRSVLAKLISPTAPLDGPLTRHRVIGAVRRLLLSASDGAPVLVVLDDAHRADDATVSALVHLGATPVVPVLSYRQEEASDTLTREVARLRRGARGLELDLGALDREDGRTLVTEAAPAPLDAVTVERIVTAGQGNPFFTLELARNAVAGRAPALTSTVREAITTRFLDLDQHTVAFLTRLAVASDDLDPLTVTALTGGDEAEEFAHLELALRVGVLVVSDARYRFRHDLVRQALVDQVAPHQSLLIHRDVAERLAATGAAPGLVARHWLDGGCPSEAVPWLLRAARQAVELAAFTDGLRHLEPLLRHAPEHLDALCLRAEALDALGAPGAPSAYARAADIATEPMNQELRAKQALAQLKLGDVSGALRTLKRVEPVTVSGRLAKALTLSGAAALGFADPALGTAKAAECRRLALESGDRGALVIASWAHAAAAHARGELRASVRADLWDTHALPELAVNVFDGQLCVTQRLLYGARPYADVIAFADSLATEAQRLGAARGHAFAVTLRGEAEVLSGRLDDGERDLTAGADLHHAIAAATGEALALQRLAEIAIHRGRAAEATVLLDDALGVARESDVGFHLLDRIYGTRMSLATDRRLSLAALDDAEAAVRGPLETCPGCRITFAAPAAIAAARGGDLDRALQYQQLTEYLATVVMRLPAWNAALNEVKGHVACAQGDVTRGVRHFRDAAADFRQSSQPLDEQRCRRLASGAWS